jgi:hypothetical protein
MANTRRRSWWTSGTGIERSVSKITRATSSLCCYKYRNQDKELLLSHFSDFFFLFYFKKKKKTFYFSVLFVIWLDFYWAIGVGCTEWFLNPTPGGGLRIFRGLKGAQNRFQVAISPNRPNIFDSKSCSTNEHYSYNNWTCNQIISTDIDW